jgi:serine/threonine protein kinase
MTVNVTTEMDVASDWLESGEAARICGLDLRPLPNSVLAGRPQSITKGQATVFFLEQVPQGNVWLLKIFSPGRRPTDDYLRAVSSCLPGGAGFFTCTQRRLLAREYLDVRRSTYTNIALVDLIDGAVLMPKVPGSTWASIADDLRDGTLVLSTAERLQMCINLAGCVCTLEAGQCCHRDISHTNVFFDQDGRAYLIDWDCLYHPQLTFQPNTTVGTMGCIAPFIRACDGNADPALSWCAYSDRFALAVLITEILLVGRETPLPHEDGTLFSQAQIDSAGNDFVTDQIQKLKKLSKPCGYLLQQAFSSSNFSECPSPCDWVSALKYTVRTQGNDRNENGRHIRRDPSIRVACGSCGVFFRIPHTKYVDLSNKGKTPLCRDCFEAQLREWSAGRAQQNMAFPQIRCEHCQKNLRMPREKLDVLLAQGKPILCAACLAEQLQKWQAEYNRAYARVRCAECGKSFGLSRSKLKVLQSKGKKLLCKDCLEVSLNLSTAGERVVSPQASSSHSSLWSFIGRIINGYSL